MRPRTRLIKLPLPTQNLTRLHPALASEVGLYRSGPRVLLPCFGLKPRTLWAKGPVPRQFGLTNFLATIHFSHVHRT